MGGGGGGGTKGSKKRTAVEKNRRHFGSGTRKRGASTDEPSPLTRTTTNQQAVDRAVDCRHGPEHFSQFFLTTNDQAKREREREKERDEVVGVSSPPNGRVLGATRDSHCATAGPTIGKHRVARRPTAVQEPQPGDATPCRTV